MIKGVNKIAASTVRTYITKSEAKEMARSISHGRNVLMARLSPVGYFRVLDPMHYYQDDLDMYDMLYFEGDTEQSQKDIFYQIWDYICLHHLDKQYHKDFCSYLTKPWDIEHVAFNNYDIVNGNKLQQQGIKLVPAKSFITNDYEINPHVKALRIKPDRTYCISDVSSGFNVPANVKIVHAHWFEN